MKKTVKFEIGDLLPIGLTLIVAGIGIVYGLNVVSDVQSDMIEGSSNYGGALCSGVGNTANCTNSAAINASGSAIEGIAKIPEKMPLIATVIVAAIIIGILVRYLMVRFA